MDTYDWKIIDLLEKNANLTHQEIGDLIGLSVSQCCRRKKALEDAGIIEGYVAKINKEALGLNIAAIIHISLKKHDEHSRNQMLNYIASQNEIHEAISLSGDSDFILKVHVENLNKLYGFVTHKLLVNDFISNVKTHIILKKHKEYNVFNSSDLFS